MAEYRRGSHTLYDIKYHFVWITKYRYQVLKGPIAHRLRELLRQGCESRDMTIIKGAIRPDHIHLLIACPPQLAPSKIVQYLKGRSSRLVQEEFPQLKQRYWGQHLWARGYFCGTVGTVTDEMIREYIEKHEDKGGQDTFTISE